jgi:eukaryotic-like serine/threonine-protein kinase
VAFGIGQRVGDYEVVGMLGVGGMGRVYQVRNIISNRIEAMKVLLPDLVAEPDLADRFISEIRTLASFDHPNIAQLHTAFQVDNQLVMVMEFVEGSTLEQRAKQGPIPQGDVINYMQQVLSALSYAHGRGVVHRDIKPANIMVTSPGVVKLMDFGIAKSSVDKDLTSPGTTIGSMYYMSPEQVRGGTVDARSDIYSAGVTMYELFAGRRPFEADSAYAILNQQCSTAPQPPVEVNQQLPKALSDLILACLAKDPANRFQNAQAVSNALRHVAAAQESQPKTEEIPFTPVVISAPPVVAARPSSAHRGAWIALGALAVLAAVALAAVGLPHLRGISAQRQSAGEPVAQKSLVATAPDTPAAVTPAPVTPAPTDAAAMVPDPHQTSDQATDTERAPVNPGSVTSPHSSARPEYKGPPTNESQNEGARQPENSGPTAEQVNEERNQAHEQMTGLNARASAVSASVEGLKHQQEADGLGLRQDMAGAYARMNNYLRAASADLDSGNLAAARTYMDKADKEISTLESFFGK